MALISLEQLPGLRTASTRHHSSTYASSELLITVLGHNVDGHQVRTAIRDCITTGAFSWKLTCSEPVLDPEKRNLSHARLRPMLSCRSSEANAQLQSPQAGPKDVRKLFNCLRPHEVQHTSAWRFDAPMISGGPWSIMEILELQSRMHLPEG